jgi:hypothetical protein
LEEELTRQRKGREWGAEQGQGIAGQKVTEHVCAVLNEKHRVSFLVGVGVEEQGEL